MIFAHASNDETINHLETLIKTYPDIKEFINLLADYNTLGRKINKFISYVENNWRT
ncbi:hypothetical protein ACFLRQ_02905 [Bacteroidota bacterium]